MLLLEGFTAEEFLSLTNDELRAIVFRDEPIVFKAGSAQMLGKFELTRNALVLELGHIDGGGEGALPMLASLASRFARRERLEYIEWRVHAVTCAKPNPKLRRVLERRGFEVRDIPGIGQCYWLRSPVELGGVSGLMPLKKQPPSS